MRLSSVDLPMFFEAPHAALAARLVSVAPELERAEQGSDRDVVEVMARANLFELVCAQHLDTPALFPYRTVAPISCVVR